MPRRRTRKTEIQTPLLFAFGIFAAALGMAGAYHATAKHPAAVKAIRSLEQLLAEPSPEVRTSATPPWEMAKASRR